MNPQKKLSMAGTNRMDAHLENRMQTSEKKCEKWLRTTHKKVKVSVFVWHEWFSVLSPQTSDLTQCQYMSVTAAIPFVH